VAEVDKAIIYAEIGEEFQEYSKNGKRVKQGKRIGIERLNKKGEWELILDKGVKYG
jgi:hypothetical protein